MRLDRQQLVSIGNDYLCQRLRSWQQQYLLRTGFSATEFPALARAARLHGVPSQRGIAAWSLQGCMLETDPHARQWLESWLATPAIGALERTLLLEIWLCASQFGTTSAEQPALQAALSQCLGSGAARMRGQLALQEAARAWQMTCDCLVPALEQALAALRATLDGIGSNHLLRSREALLGSVPGLIQALRDAGTSLGAACAGNAAEQPAQSLDACWQTLSIQTRHTLPGAILALQSSLEDAQQRTSLGGVQALERALELLTQVEGITARLPQLLAGAVACVRIACELAERGCLPVLDALRLTVLEQRLATAETRGINREWYAALSRLPEDFPADGELTVQPLSQPLNSLTGHSLLGSALAQATLFNTVQALESILKPSAALLIEQLTPQPMPGPDLGDAMSRLDEHIASLSALIATLDQHDEPGPAHANALEDVQLTVQTLSTLVRALESKHAHLQPASEAFHRCAALLGRNLQESAMLLVKLSAA
ncbi:hypothetical protein [Pseudomonas putida]